MTHERMSEEMLMAYVDNELDEADARLVEAAARSDGSIAERIERLRQTRLAVRDAYAGLIDEPVPARLEERVRSMIDASGRAGAGGDRVVPFKSAGRRPMWRTSSAGWALAASITAVAIGVGGYLAGQSTRGPGAAVVALGRITTEALATALSSLPSGEERELGPGEAVKLVLSFRDSSGTLCREFEIGRPAGRIVCVACRPGDDWRVNFAMATGETGSEYAPASSTEALDAYLSAISASQPLTREEELAALRPGG